MQASDRNVDFRPVTKEPLTPEEKLSTGILPEEHFRLFLRLALQRARSAIVSALVPQPDGRS